MESIINESARQHGERESAWHELLANNCLQEISNDYEQLEMAKKAKCYYVVEYLLEKLQKYGEILETYLFNEQRHETIFCYMERYAHVEERKIYEQMKMHFKKLLEINPKEIARIVVLHYPEKIDDLMNSLVEVEQYLYIFLDHLNQRKATFTSEQAEAYVELLCKLSTEQQLEEFLRKTNVYDSNKALETVKRYNFNSASIYLLEKQGKYQDAFDLSLKMLNTSTTDQLQDKTEQLINLCTRASVNLPHDQSQKLWFSLLEKALPREDLKSITKTLLHEASLHVDLPNLIQMVMNTNNVSGSFGDIKDLLMSMLTNSSNDVEILEQSADMQGLELNRHFAECRKEAQRGLWVTMIRCVVCHQKLNNNCNILIMGNCSHGLHESCVNDLKRQFKSDKELELEDDNNDIIKYRCPRCMSEISDDILTLPMHLSEPSHKLFSNSSDIPELGKLQLKSPPRKF